MLGQLLLFAPSGQQQDDNQQNHKQGQPADGGVQHPAVHGGQPEAAGGRGRILLEGGDQHRYPGRRVLRADAGDDRHVVPQGLQVHGAGVAGVLVDGHRHADIHNGAGQHLPLLGGSIKVMIPFHIAAGILGVPVGVQVLQVGVAGDIGVARRTHHAAHSLGVAPDDLPEVLVGADQAAALHRALRLSMGGGLHHSPVHIHPAVDGHAYVVLPVDGNQCVQNLAADLVVDLVLILQLQCADLGQLSEAAGVGIVVARGVVDRDVGYLQPLQAEGHRIADGRHHAAAQGLCALQLDGNRGGGRGGLRVQHIDALRPRGKLHSGITDAIELADDGCQILLSSGQPHLIPLVAGIHQALVVQVKLIHEPGVHVARHSHLCLELGLPPLGHQNGVPPNLVVGHAVVA